MTQTTGTKRVFDMRFEARYGQTMSSTDIEAARDVVNEMHKLAEKTLSMYNYNHDNYIRYNRSLGTYVQGTPNISRAARNIVRFNSLIDEAEYEVDSLHEAYIAQFTDFDEDGDIIDTLPDFDFSEQSILEAKATEYLRNAHGLLIRAILVFAKVIGVKADFFELLNDTARYKFIHKHVLPKIRRQFNDTASNFINNTAILSVFIAKNSGHKNFNRKSTSFVTA